MEAAAAGTYGRRILHARSGEPSGLQRGRNAPPALGAHVDTALPTGEGLRHQNPRVAGGTRDRLDGEGVALGATGGLTVSRAAQPVRFSATEPLGVVHQRNVPVLAYAPIHAPVEPQRHAGLLAPCAGLSHERR